MVDYTGIARIIGTLGGDVIPQIEKVATKDATVLINGDSGVGKEVVALAIHEESRRSGKYVVVNCPTIPGNLLESELFGHTKGSFTGAGKDRVGKFEHATNGTIFLDEITEIDVTLQAKLLRILQERTYERVGDNETRRTNARIIAASNQDLEKAVRAGKLREDLYYRLQVFEINIPPLRDRKEDIGPLVNYFLKKYLLDENAAESITIADEFMRILREYDFPGNVRELENCIQRAVILMEGDRIIRSDFLPDRIKSESKREVTGNSVPNIYENFLKELQRHGSIFDMDLLIRKAIELTGDETEAAKLFNLDRSTISRRLKK